MECKASSEQNGKARRWIYEHTSMLPRPSFGSPRWRRLLDPGPLVALKIRVTVQCGVTHFEISLPRLPLGPGACIDDPQTPDFNDIPNGRIKRTGTSSRATSNSSNRKTNPRNTSRCAPQEDTTLVPPSASPLKRPLPHKIPILTVSLLICASDPETS